MTIFTGQLGTVYSLMSHIELGTAPSAPLPPPSPIQSLHAPQLTRTPQGDDFDKRVRRNMDILVEMINSLTMQGFITKISANPAVWQIITTTAGVLSFNGRSGNVVLNGDDVESAFGPQNPHDIFAGPTPSFRPMQSGDLPLVPGVAGTYTSISSITIDQYGRVTAITGTSEGLDSLVTDEGSDELVTDEGSDEITE